MVPVYPAWQHPVGELFKSPWQHPVGEKWKQQRGISSSAMMIKTLQRCVLPNALIRIPARCITGFGVRTVVTGAPMDPRPPVPDFTFETATMKVRAAEDAWNSRDPKRVALAYTVDSAWRNRSQFVNGRQEIEQFLTRKWENEAEYRLIKELFAFTGNRIAVRFAYEWLNTKENQWYRAYGNENWEFDDLGYMAKRYASINDVAIDSSERKFHWPQGTRPKNHPSLSELGL